MRCIVHLRPMKMKFLFLSLLLPGLCAFSQNYPYPTNGAAHVNKPLYAISGATIHVSPDVVIENGTLLVQENRIVDVGKDLRVPENAIQVKLSKDKHIYASFIDLWSDYGLPEPIKRQYAPNQMDRPNPAAAAWNMAIKPETDAAALFQVKQDLADTYRKTGFGAALTHQRDGIARGTGALVSFASVKENEALIRPGAASFYSFEKGSSTQDYPSSQMGGIALLRQTFYDARYYESTGRKSYQDLSMEALLRQKNLPQFFEVRNWQEVLRAQKIAEEFGFKITVKTGGDDYQALEQIAESGINLVLPLNFPDPWDLSDSYVAHTVPLASLKHWEAAPCNPALVHRAEIPFALTLSGIKNISSAFDAMRKAVAAGLPANELLRALTTTPASFINATDQMGELKKGKLANFFIASDSLLHSDMRVLETWVQGRRYTHGEIESVDLRGTWQINSESGATYQLEIKGKKSAPRAEISGIENEALQSAISYNRKQVNLKFKSEAGVWLWNASVTGSNNAIKGKATTPWGKQEYWEASLVKAYVDTVAQENKELAFTADSIRTWIPNSIFGFKELPKSETLLITNATVWTCEEEGRLENADVLIHNGKILGVGRSLAIDKLVPRGIEVKKFDGTGKHISPGIIDEHSHIAISNGVNEGAQSNTAEVRIGDVIDSRDTDIYYALAGGVTTAQLLHGSANPIGGQAAMIKLRWGLPPEELKYKNAPGHIKFALGENVKQSNWGHQYTVRFPQTRMGVEQVYYDAFQRALDYKAEWDNWEKTKKGPAPRKDLELEALREILENRRHITCHSYVQSEINMLMHVADSMGFKVNTFTHILEGYKVADKMKAHGANASTFSDWWAYKMEVSEAIPYNGSIMQKVGITTGFNSDDAEMGRRLNQEAAKAILYGGISEEEALKFVTLNPAKMLKIDASTGSLKAGKDADLVIWDNNPLSVYAKVEATFVDGVRYYDRERNAQLLEEAQKERARITAKMLNEKAAGASTRKPVDRKKHFHHCDYIGNEDNEWLGYE